MTDRSVLKGSTVTSCMYFETLVMNSGKPTGTCICHRTPASGEAVEMAGTRSDMETDRGGSVTAAEARHSLRDPTGDKRESEGGAGAETGEPPISRGKTNGGPDTATGAEPGIAAEAETGRGVKVETDGGRGAEIQTGSTSIEVKVETVGERTATGLEEAKTGVPRKTTKRRKPIKLRAVRIDITNIQKRARKRVRRNTRRKKTKGRLHLENLKRRILQVPVQRLKRQNRIRETTETARVVQKEQMTVLTMT